MINFGNVIGFQLATLLYERRMFVFTLLALRIHAREGALLYVSRTTPYGGWDYDFLWFNLWWRAR